MFRYLAIAVAAAVSLESAESPAVEETETLQVTSTKTNWCKFFKSKDRVCKQRGCDNHAKVKKEIARYC